MLSGVTCCDGGGGGGAPSPVPLRHRDGNPTKLRMVRELQRVSGGGTEMAPCWSATTGALRSSDAPKRGLSDCAPVKS